MKLTIKKRSTQLGDQDSSEKYNRDVSARQSVRKDLCCREIEFAESDSHLDVPPRGMQLRMARDTQCDQVVFRVIPRAAAKLLVVDF